MIWDRRPRLGKGAVEMGGGDTFLSLAWSRKRSAGGIRRPGGWDAFDAAVLKARGLGAVAGRCAPTVPAPKAQPKLGACAAQGRRSVESAQSGPGQPLCSGPETRRDPTPRRVLRPRLGTGAASPPLLPALRILQQRPWREVAPRRTGMLETSCSAFRSWVAMGRAIPLP
jgi:hypothetical protein